MENLETLIEKIDFVELHKAAVQDWGQNIEIYEDGSIAVLSQGSWTEGQGCVAILKTYGVNETAYYSEGWAEEITDDEDENFGMYKTDDGRILTEEEMVDECIEEGDHFDWIEANTEEIERQIEEDLQNKIMFSEEAA